MKRCQMNEFHLYNSSNSMAATTTTTTTTIIKIDSYIFLPRIIRWSEDYIISMEVDIIYPHEEEETSKGMTLIFDLNRHLSSIGDLPPTTARSRTMVATTKKEEKRKRKS